MKKELSTKEFIALFILFLMLLFQNILEQYIAIFKFFDESLIGVLFIVYLYKQFIVGIKLNKEIEELIKHEYPNLAQWVVNKIKFFVGCIR